MKPIKVGVVGAGQLGRMMALAGIPMGIQFCFLDRTVDAPAAGLGEIHLGSFDDPAAIGALAEQVDVLTFDVENVPATALRAVEDIVTVAPGATALETTQDRLSEKKLFHTLGIRTAGFIAVDSKESLANAAQRLGFPCVVKTRRFGYDGRGQRFLRTGDDIDKAWQTFSGHDLIVEQFIAFEREVSLVSVRAHTGDTHFYALTENVHANGILHHSNAPYGNRALQQEAQEHAQSIMEQLDYVGVMTIEFFVVNGELLANEIAPRVHNSGHWTIEGAVTSQFANHIRAICHLPIGNCDATGHSAMVNFLGTLPTPADCLTIDRLHFHDYGKSPRPSRKIGHATIVCDTRQDCEQRTAQLMKLYEADLQTPG